MPQQLIYNSGEKHLGGQPKQWPINQALPQEDKAA